MAVGIFGLEPIVDWYIFLAILMGGLALFFMIVRVMPIARYSYPSARIRVMKGKMLGEDKLHELVESMDYKDVIGSFEGTGYEQFVAGKKELKEVEKSLSLNLAHDYKTIVSMSPRKAEVFFKMASARYDIENIKNIMAAKETGDSVTEFMPGPLSETFLQKLNESSTLAEVIELMKATDYKDVAESLPADLPSREYQKILDKYVFENLLKKRKVDEAARTAGVMQDSQFLFKIYGMQVDILNLKILFRCIRDRLGAEKTKPLLIKNGHFIPEKKAEALAESNDVSTAVNALEGTPYYAVLGECLREFEKEGSLLSLEQALNEYYIERIKSLYLQQPFGLTPIACYLALKETEIANLKAILNGIREELPKEQIKRIVVGFGKA